MKTEITAECGTGSGMEMSFLRSGKDGNCSKLVQGSSETMWFWISMKWPWGLFPTSSFFIDQLLNHVWLSTPAPLASANTCSKHKYHTPAPLHTSVPHTHTANDPPLQDCSSWMFPGWFFLRRLTSKTARQGAKPPQTLKFTRRQILKK